MALLAGVATKKSRAKKPRPKPSNGARVRSTSGEKAAFELAMAAAPPPDDDDAEQFDWVDDLVGPMRGPEVREIRNKIGRPPGSRNKRTVEFAEYLLSRYTSPAEGLARIANMSIEELVAATGCTRLEALQEKRLAMIPLLPYLHSKMPVSIDITNRKIIYLHIGGELMGPPPAAPQPLQGVGLTATVIEGKATSGHAAGNQASVDSSGTDNPGVHVREEARPDHQRAGGQR